MATKKTVTDQEVAPVIQEQIESEYTVQEFAKASEKLFGATPDLVVAAFKVNNITSTTKTKAKEIVETFSKKEVE